MKHFIKTIQLKEVLFISDSFLSGEIFLLNPHLRYSYCCGITANLTHLILHETKNAGELPSSCSTGELLLA